MRVIYSKKFPVLESPVVSPLDYLQVVQRIGNAQVLTTIDFSDILPSTAVMAISVTASMTAGSTLLHNFAAAGTSTGPSTAATSSERGSKGTAPRRRAVQPENAYFLVTGLWGQRGYTQPHPIQVEKAHFEFGLSLGLGALMVACRIAGCQAAPVAAHQAALWP